MPDWDHVTDFLVVGSGGGLCGAVAASMAGLDVLVVEKDEFLGGSMGISGGVLWLPDNPLMRREGVSDSLETAMDYFASVVGEIGPASSPARRRSYVLEGSKLVHLLEQEGIEFARCEGYSDYYADVPGFTGGNARGRAIEVVPTDIKNLGFRLRPAIAAPLVVRTGEAGALTLIRVSARSMLKAVGIGARTVADRLRGRRMTSNGGALIARLLGVLQRRQVPVWTGSPVIDLIQEDGRVVGAAVRKNGRDVRVQARAGVLLASGGFAQNADMRAKYGGDQPNDARWTLTTPGDSGELMQRAIELNAATDLMDEAWWVPVLRKPDGTLALVIQERARPGAIIVDASGRRYFNEAGSSMEVGQHMYRRQAETGGGVPSWLIIDSRHRARYLFAMMPPGFTPKKWLTSGAMKRDATLAGLARQCGMEAGTLAATVDRFNQLAAEGVDHDFGRGVSAHDRYMGDPTHGPNPCLGPLAKPPFYAVQIFPGDVGTSGGLLCDEHSRVLDVSGDPIPGLYATGNATASVMGRAYPAGGASIGASCVFAFIAGNHAVDHTA